MLLIRVFLSSPGDVTQERQAVLKVLENLPNRPSFREKVAFRAIAWDKVGAHTPLLATMSPQEAIDAGLPRPSACDIVITIFHARIGTPFTAGGKSFLSGTHYELLDALSSDRPIPIIYKRTQKPDIDLDDADALLQYATLKKFLDSDLFYDETRQIKRSINTYETPADFAERIEYDIEEIVVRLLNKQSSQPQPIPAPETQPTGGMYIELKTDVWQGSPFPGLRSFKPADKPIFFGRERETDGLIKRISENRFVAVVGASGSGKSSLVGAGFIPSLNANAISTDKTGSKDWAVVQFTPGGDNHPFEALFNALITTFPQLKPSGFKRDEELESFINRMMQTPNPMKYVLDDALEKAPAWSEVLFFIDQFEELFTIAKPDTIAPFIQMIDFLTKHLRARVVITMRADFYQRAVENHSLSQLLQSGTYPLSAPIGGALYRMITRPAERANLVFEDGLPEQLLADTGDEAGALALLAYTLDELYKIASQRGDNRLTFADYQALGGVAGAIGARAEAIYAGLPYDDDTKQRLLGQVFKELVEVDERGTATRQRAPFGRFNEAEHALIYAFASADARLLVMGEGEHDDEVEVAHEALFRSWATLANWIREAQDDLILLRQVKNAAHEWHSKGRKDFLRWNHERLELVYAMQQRQNPTLNEVERDFIEPEATRLLRELDDINTPHPRRYQIGERLAEIGDPRPHIGVLPNGVPDIGWCLVEVPENSQITIKEQRFKLEKPFYVAKYLTTYAQYEAFVKAEDGYNNVEWWKLFPEEYQPPALRPATNGNANAPRDTISWYQSVAFAHWMDARYRQNGLFETLLGLNPADWKISLPREWMWQWMAQNGAEAREYPWGAWDEYPRANTREAQINDKSTSVGMYPHGVAVCGAYDVAGNLREWCLNDYYNAPVINGYSNKEQKVFRGGSFDNDSDNARVVYRRHNLPDIVNSYYGFRVFVVPIHL
jgi:formylglycine-generating enzyme required for sulfatase activity/energy-coupling factor transporter ATP-binding protein EcfA2